MIKAIIFDMGGVLRKDADVKGFWKGSIASKKLRIKFGTGLISVKEFVKKGAKLLNLTEKEFLKKYKKEYGKIKLKKDVFKIYKKIKLDKYILSDNNPIHHSFEKKKFNKIFKIAKKNFLSQEIGMRKNTKKIFKFVLKEIGVKPKETIMIDNRPDCLSYAKKSGLNTILFKNSNQLKKDLKKFNIKCT